MTIGIDNFSEARTGTGHAVGQNSVDADVILGVYGTDGVFKLPLLTDAQRDALTAVEGAVIYNATDDKIEVYTGAAWEAVTSV
jgi:hypothetical protein